MSSNRRLKTPDDHVDDWCFRGYKRRVQRQGSYKSFLEGREVRVSAEEAITFHDAKAGAKVFAACWPEVDGVEVSTPRNCRVHHTYPKRSSR